MKTLVELDAHFRKHLKIDNKIKTMWVNHPYSKDGIIDLLVGMCYTYHNRRSLLVMPSYIPNVETKKINADFDNLEYKQYWSEDDSRTKDEFVESIKNLLNEDGITINS